jgi:PAS domain S-box-containing protein
MATFRGHGLAWLTLAVVGLASALGAITFSYVWSDSRSHKVEEFEARADSEARAVSAVLDKTLTALESTGALYEVAVDVSRTDFSTFAEGQLEAEPAMQAIEWIPRVPSAERAAYESDVHVDGHSHFTFSERDAQGELIPAGDRDIYYPVFLVEPLLGNEAALGFDLGSNPARLSALEAARDSGEFVVTQRITLVQEQETGFGFLGVLPEYEGGISPQTVEERRERLRGFILGVFRAVDLLGRPASPGDTGVHMALIDRSAPEGERLLYGERPIDDFDKVDSAFLKSLDYQIGGREWRLLMMPSGVLPSPWASPQAIGAAAGVLLVALLTGGFVVVLLRRNQEIRTAVRARTLELRHTRDELRLTVQQNQAILDGAGAGIIALDLDERIVAMNPAGLNILGIAEESDLVGFTLDEVNQRYGWVDVSPESTGSWGVIWALREGHSVEVASLPVTRIGGRKIHVASIASPLYDDSGALTGAVTVIRDISEMIRVNRAKEEFLAMTGHELRTPLTAIHAALGLVSSGALGDVPEAMISPLENAARNSDRLVKLVSDILALETMTLGEATLDVAPAQAFDVVREVVDLNSVLSAEHAIIVAAHGEGFEAVLDSSRMIQALTNLLQNALKFAPSGTTIEISAYADNGQGVFEVSDQGPGIPDDKVGDIFGMFEQADSSDARLYGGVGLGLAITRVIAERHGGRVWVESTSEAGTTFKLAVPLAGPPAA